MDSTYTQAEQDKLDYAEALEAAYRRGERFYTKPNGDLILVNEAQVRHARLVADNQRENARKREQRIAEHQAGEAEKAAQREAEREASIRQELRRHFAGTDAEFAAAYPQLKAAWQQQRMLQSLGAQRSQVYDGF